MSHFIFKAKTPTGEMYSGEKEAADRYELYKLLREKGDEVIEFKEKQGSKKRSERKSFFSGRVKMIEKITFARNLGSMLQAGLALSRALAVLEQQTKNKTFKTILLDVIAQIGRGTTFADALSKHGKTFPNLFVAMVHAGEQSGTLAESLKVVANQMESTYNLDRRIKGALIYPGVIVTAMVLIAILMFIFVIPTLLKTFTDLNVELPFTTRMVVYVSDLIQNHGLLVLAALLVIGGMISGFAKQEKGKRFFHRLFLKIPLIGPLVQEVNTARTARTLSSLLGSGVDIVESVSITAAVVQNVHYQEVLSKAATAIKKGDLMSKIFNEYQDLYPIFFIQMMGVGEETGKTGEMLLGVAKYYEDDVDQQTKNMSTIIEPILILVIGAAVGFFAISMIQPMYSLVNVI